MSPRLRTSQPPAARLLALIGAAALLSGCASTLDGLGGRDRYGCGLPEGATCAPVSAVHATSLRAGTPAPGLPAGAPAVSGALGVTDRPPLANTDTGEITPASLRAAPRVLRLWVAPWEDADGDLHESTLVHVVVDHGRWLIERIHPATQRSANPVRPPMPRAPGSGPGSASPAPGPATPAAASAASMGR
jgi:conjugal transfer pilus assembly protein TraV